MRVAYPLTLTFKFLTISSYIRVVDATGQLVSYVKQRAFRLKEDVTIFADEAQAQPAYHIKASRISSLTVNGNRATLQGVASIYDITNGSTLLDAYATFEVSVTDLGGTDSIAISIRNSTSALWFSSNWNGVNTMEQLLSGGDIKVR